MRSDRDIRRDVERELEWEPSLDAGEIGVAVKDGTVTLSGFVHEYLHRWNAEKAAKRVAGVRGLANDIQLRLTVGDQRTDGEIAHAAVMVLQNTPSVPEGKIRPVVREGNVTLEGEVEWQYQRDAAERAIRNLRGVRGLTNAVALKPKLRPSTAGVEAKIAEALRRSALLDARGIAVRVVDGTVILTGKVPSYWERDEAENAAWAAPGVTRVTNRLTIAAPVHSNIDGTD